MFANSSRSAGDLTACAGTPEFRALAMPSCGFPGGELPIAVTCAHERRVAQVPAPRLVAYRSGFWIAAAVGRDWLAVAVGQHRRRWARRSAVACPPPYPSRADAM